MSERENVRTSPAYPIKSRLKIFIYFFIILVVAVSVVIGLSRLYANQINPDIKDNQIYKLFQSKQLMKLSQQLQSKQSRIINLVGKKSEGIYFFIQNFLKTKISEGFNIKIREYQQNSSIQFHTNQYFVKINDFIQSHFFQRNQTKHNYWIISTDIPLAQNALQELKAISEKYIDDKFIIVSKESIKSQILVLKFKKISGKKIQSFLTSLGMDNVLINILTEYHKNDLQYINFIINSSDPKSTIIQEFDSEIKYFQNFLSNITENNKIHTILNQLCEKGIYKSKKNLIQENQIVIYKNKQYSWKNITFINAYSIIKNKQCVIKIFQKQINQQFERENQGSIKERNNQQQQQKKKRKQHINIRQTNKGVKEQIKQDWKKEMKKDQKKKGQIVENQIKEKQVKQQAKKKQKTKSPSKPTEEKQVKQQPKTPSKEKQVKQQAKKKQKTKSPSKPTEEKQVKQQTKKKQKTKSPSKPTEEKQVKQQPKTPSKEKQVKQQTKKKQKTKSSSSKQKSSNQVIKYTSKIQSISANLPNQKRQSNHKKSIQLNKLIQ